MPRLIDADALIPMMKYATTDSEIGVFPIKIGFNAIIEVINNAPTIDAEPVRHGKWIGYAGTIGNECSVCGKWIDVLQGTAEMNYCPHCGARMDKE